MGILELSNRLQTLADLVPEGAHFADIGTDHGQLPVWLLLQGRIQTAIAADVRPGPLERARATAARHGVLEQVSFRLCDGLSGILPQEADAVTVAGMGGETIAAILSAAPWTTGGTLLLLQPMTSAPDLRDFLQQHGYCIHREHLARDQGTIYVTLEVTGGSMPPLTEGERWCGRRESWADGPLWADYLCQLTRKLTRELNGAEQSSKPEDLPRRSALRRTLQELNTWKGELSSW